METEPFSASILVIDDQPGNLTLLQRILTNQGYKVHLETNGITAIETAKNNLPDLILLDIYLPEMDGYDVCIRLKEIDLLKDVPVIFISTLSDVLDKVKAFSVGGIDYITKPFDFEEVLARVKTHLKIRGLQTQLEEKTANLEAEIARRIKAEAELKRLASLDPLTGIHNRRTFFELAEVELERALRYGDSITLLMMDIDHFKKVNDCFGHIFGDQILINFAHLCKNHLRSFDLVARYGGEEFIIMLPHTDIEAGKSIAERIRLLVKEKEYTCKDQTFTVTVSAGITELDHTKPIALSALIEQADQALYQAKRSGRNQVECWSPEPKSIFSEV
jgi:diguanylate cyclase (GGDEF)-like protein